MKKIIISILIFMCFIGIASATTVNLDPQGILANASYSTSSTITYNLNVTGNQSVWNCKLFTNENASIGVGNWREVQTDSGVLNNTNTDFIPRNGIADVSGTPFQWNVFCNGSTDPIGAWGGTGLSNSTNFNGSGSEFGVDTLKPVVTINHPTTSRHTGTTGNEVWFNGNEATALRIGLTVIDNNADECVLKTNLNVTSIINTTGTYQLLNHTTTYTNNTPFNFSWINSSQGWDDDASGDYLWTYVCNDSAGQSTSLGINYTFYFDTLDPGEMEFNLSHFRTSGNRILNNNSIATDYSPQVGWNATVDLNFSRYEIVFWNGTAAFDVRLNITDQTTIITNMSPNLIGDTLYFINVTAWDEAGNSNGVTDNGGFLYTTDSTNRALKSGWNIIGNPGNAFTLSEILNWTGATTASFWNDSHFFESHTDGGSYIDTSIVAGGAVLLYFDADTTVSDLIWNTSALPLFSLVTNTTQSNWNIAVNQNWTNNYYLAQIDKSTNGNKNDLLFLNITSFSYYNNSASTGSKYISYICNWTDYSPNNNTQLKFAETMWVYSSDTVNVGDSLYINWSNI